MGILHMNYKMHRADIVEWAASYEGEPFHAAFMDAPYELGFMGKGWDRSGVAFRTRTWELIKQLLYPGAFGMTFAGTRTYHRMACAIEDAGFVIHPMMCYAFGSGFPKATRPDVQIDRRRGNDRTVVGTRKHAPKFDAAGHGYREKDNGFNSRERETFDVTAPGSDESAAWSGHRYGLQCIKPALEPIIVFQKPYSRAGAVADMLATGAGAIWIDGGRIAGEPWSRNNKPGQNGAFNASGGPNSNDMGRWPSNLLLIHTPRCDADGCADDCPVARLGAQSGERNSSKSGGEYGTYRQNDHGNDVYRRGLASAVPNRPPIGDTGTAARYFFQADYVLDRMEEADPVYYCAKASRAEREAGLDPRTVAFMRDLDDSDDDAPTFDEVTVDDGRKKSIDNAYQRGETKRRNPHPTVKPLSLSRYLATLLLPPERYAPRRLLIPFAGVGSELIGGLLAGWDEIDGIELDEDGTHIPVANARISYWTARRAELADPSKPITVKAAPRAPAGQLDMFVKEGS